MGRPSPALQRYIEVSESTSVFSALRTTCAADHFPMPCDEAGVRSRLPYECQNIPDKAQGVQQVMVVWSIGAR